MGEVVVGLVASAIGIAGLATKIVKTTIKVKGLLEQINNVPEELQQHLDQIQLISQILTSDINDDGPPALRGALDVAKIQCQKAAEGLRKVAEDLHAQVHGGGRARRKIRSARVVLQKDVLASHEKRLASTMQMLMMACNMYGMEQRRYIIDLQTRQPDVIVARILGSLQVPSPIQTSPQQSHDPVGQSTDLAMSRKSTTELRAALWNQKFQPFLKLGITSLTGSLEVQCGSNAVDQKRNEVFSDLQLRINLPRWLTSKSLDSILRRSQAGWQYHLHTSTLHPQDSSTWELMTRIIGSGPDSLQMLQSLIAEGRVSVYDTKYNSDGKQETMMHVALRYWNWPICAFLAEYDVPVLIPGPHLGFHRWERTESQLQYIENVASRYSNNLGIIWSIIQLYEGPVAQFDTLRRAVWPDIEFYDSAFLCRRLLLAGQITDVTVWAYARLPKSKQKPTPSQEPVVRALLSRNGKIYIPDLGPLLLNPYWYGYTTDKMRQLLRALGTTSAHNRSTDASGTNIWAKLVEDVVVQLVGSPDTSEPIDETWSSGPSKHWIYNGLFDISILGYSTSGCEWRQENYESACRCSTETVRIMFHQYLTVLSRCGVDLGEYGRVVESRFTDNGISEAQILCKRRGGFPIVETWRVRTGPELEDWKIWFAEPTDKFAGEFWQLVDPAPLYIPGGWVEEWW